jgi:hypothetical protein
MNTPENEDVSAGAGEQVPVKQTWIVFAMAVLEAMCVFAVAAAKTGIVLGASAAFIAGWSNSLHRDAIRIPVLLAAILGAGVNLYLIQKRQRLRNKASAAWRKRPLTRRERIRIGVVLFLSLLTLILAAAEMYFHRTLHHTIM